MKKDMIKSMKMAYNRYLFQKYGFDRGALFENIPTCYKLNPLWSPSMYGVCEGNEIAKNIQAGIKDGLKNPIQINLTLFQEENLSEFVESIKQNG